MRSLSKKFPSFLKFEDGVTTAEKALMNAMVVAQVIASVLFLTKKESSPLDFISSKATAQTTGM